MPKANNNNVTPVPNSGNSNNQPSLGMVIGISVGGVIVVLIIVSVLYLFMRHRHHHPPPYNDDIRGRSKNGKIQRTGHHIMMMSRRMDPSYYYEKALDDDDGKRGLSPLYPSS